jgi:WD40 repeat protein
LDSKSGKITRTEKTKEDNFNMAFSPDGNTFGVSNAKEELVFYDLRMFKQLKTFKFKVEVNDFCWDRQTGQVLLTADQSGKITLFNGQALSQQPLGILEYHKNACNTVAVDPSGNYFLSGGNDSLIGVWDTAECMVANTISNNDARVMQLGIS